MSQGKSVVFWMIVVFALVACSTQAVSTVAEITPEPTPISAPEIKGSSDQRWITYRNMNHVDDLRFDHDGLLWTVGQNGIVRWDPNTGTYTVNPNDPPLTNFGFSSVVPAADGTLWLGTWFNGVLHFDGQEWTSYTSEDGLADDSITSMAISADDVLYVGTHNGVSRFDGQIWTTYRTQDGLADDMINSLALSNDGVLWVGTNDPFDGGLSQFDGEEWTIHTTEDGLRSNLVNAITTTSDGSVWVGSPALSHYDGQTWTTYDAPDITCRTLYAQDLNRELRSCGITSIVQAPDGAIWIGAGLGVGRFDGNTWTAYTVEDGLPDNSVSSVTVGPDGAVWIGTRSGPARFQEGEWTTFSVDNVPAGNSITSIAVDADGSLWFGCSLIKRWTFFCQIRRIMPEPLRVVCLALMARRGRRLQLMTV